MMSSNRKMSLMMLLFLIFSGPLVSADSTPKTTLPDSNRIAEDQLPTPFSAEEIMKFCDGGRTIKYHIEVPGKPDSFIVFSFLKGSETNARLETSLLDAESKQLGGTEESRPAWKELQSHASFPAVKTKLEEEKKTVPAGTFDCWRYTVTVEKESSKVISTYWFAKQLPGPPILMEQTANDLPFYRMTMIETKK